MSQDPRESGTPDNPGVIARPPLLYAVVLAAGLLMDKVLPAGFLPRSLRKWLGVPLIIGGLSVGISAFREMRRAGTNLQSRKPTTAIVTDGPYRFTRNPIYVGMTLMYSGISALANALWPILLLPGVLAVMRKGVIEREEAYLESKFGEEYLQYKARVRRWI